MTENTTPEKKLKTLPKVSGRKWGEEAERVLKDNWATKSARDIALLLGSGYTRNSVIGKARRMGLEKNTVIDNKERKTVHVRKYKIIEDNHDYIVQLTDLKPYQCRAINEGMYCGHPVVRGAYCGLHAERYYKPKKTAKTNN